jgi:beta-phosphoglucomutase-like phosphatase (HAD superfamily)
MRAKKPDPEAYLRALATLQLGPLQAVAIEDSPGGAAAARAAGVPVVVTRSVYFETATLEGAVAIGPGLHSRRGWRPALLAADAEPDGRVGVDDLRAWCAQMDTVSQYA